MGKSILLRLATDGTPRVKADLKEVAGEVRDLSREEATIAIRVDAAQAKRDLAEVIAEAKATPRQETIRIRVAGEQQKLVALNKQMQGLESNLKRASAAGEDTDRIITRMGTVAGRIDSTRQRIEQLGSEFDSLGGRAFRAIKKIDSGIGGLLGHVPLLGGLMKGAFMGASDGLNKIVEMLPEAAQGFAGVLAAGLSLAAVAPVVLLVVAAVAALVVSLVQALIGVAALGVAFLAALAPIALIVGAVALKLKAAYTAQQNLTAATTAQKAAVVSLHQAQQSESTQRIAALQAEKDATLALHDANDQLADAKLSRKQAALNVQTAKQALKTQASSMGLSVGDLTKRASNVAVSGNFGQVQAAGFSSESQFLQAKQNVLNLQLAQQGLIDSTDGVKDAANNASKAQATSNDFAKKGVLAYAPYAAAVATAAKASVALHTANMTLGKDSKAMASSDGVLGILDKLKHTLGVILGPATAAAFKGLGTALGILGKGLKPLQGPLTTLGKAIGAGFVQLAKALTSKTAISDFKQLINGAAKLVPTLISFAAGLGGILFAVANAAMPALVSGLGGLGKKFENVAKHPQAIKRFIVECIGQTKAWFSWIGKIVGVVTTLAGIFNSFGPILAGFVTALKPVIWALGKISTALSALEATAHANDQATSLHDTNNVAQAKLIKKLQAEIANPHTSATRRKGDKATLAGLLATTTDLSSGQWNHWLDSHTGTNPHKFAVGGVVTGPTMGLLGEAGEEGVIPLAGAGAQIVGQRIGEYVARYLGNFAHSVRPSVGSPAMGMAGGGVHQHNHFGPGVVRDSQTDHFMKVAEQRLRRLGLGVR